ncbi:MAG: serine hydrolase domain-containing protein [Steroidobacteraceae bacterium]
MARFQSVRARLDAVVRTSHTPGLQFVAVTAEGPAFEYLGGWADLARRHPMGSGTTMMAYSMSKTFTAAAVLQVIDSQHLSLDESINRFLDFCPYGPEVTIRRLLAHTAGIPNPIPLAWIHSPAAHETFDEHAALARVLRRHKRLSFAPGTRYGYSNIGYWLLGEFVQQVTGVAFTAYVGQQVLRPLGVTPQELGYEIPSLPEHARGYLEKYSLMNVFKRLLVDRKFIGNYYDRWLEIYPHYLDGAAFGGLVGTARGFARFLQDQLRPPSVLFRDSSRREFYAQQHTSGGAVVPASLGWNVGSLNDRRLYYKEGGGGGFHCMMRLYPSSGVGTVVMTNATGFSVRNLLDRTDCIFLEPASSLRDEI